MMSRGVVGHQYFEDTYASFFTAFLAVFLFIPERPSYDCEQCCPVLWMSHVPSLFRIYRAVCTVRFDCVCDVWSVSLTARCDMYCGT
jgi:hypothetical protein